jgi:hypothetical protein
MVQISHTILSKIMLCLLLDTVSLKLETVGQQAYLFSGGGGEHDYQHILCLLTLDTFLGNSSQFAASTDLFSQK